MWEKRDWAITLCYIAYCVMVFVGSYFYSWTPVCFLYPLFAPKSKVGMFMNKKFVEFRHYLVQSVSAADEATTKWSIKHTILYLSYNLNVPMCMYIGVVHMMALHALIVLFFCDRTDHLLGSWVAPWSQTQQAAAPIKMQTIYFAIALWPVTAMGITAGSHRLWAHRSYKAHWIVRTFLMVLSSMANQGSVFHWARDHRTHHRHSDTPADPHDSNRGFFYSHMGWLLVQKATPCIEAGRKIDMSDLKEDPIVMFQKRAGPWWNLLWCYAIPAYITMYMWNETLWNGFLVAGVLRYCFTLHVTWSVNSIVHKFGPTTYDPKERPSESAIVSFFAMGEGWHSWHHAFSFDYATSELGCLQQFNPTKLFLDTMALFGLVTNRKRGLRMWQERKEMWKRNQNCEIVESLRGPPLFRYRHLEFKSTDGSSDEAVQALHTIDRLVSNLHESAVSSIFANIPDVKRNWTYFSVLRNIAYVYSICTLPWAIILSVVMLDVVVPARWVTAGRKVTAIRN